MTRASFVQRGFVQVGARHVHYRTAGAGPPALLLHDSPRSSAMSLALLAALADRFTVFAPDTPGFGLSDALPGDALEVAQLADAWAETLRALGIDCALVYGIHGSAKVALELARRHPPLVAALTLDGLTIPAGGGPAVAPLRELVKPYEIRDDGAHLAELWFRVREQFNFNPWPLRSLATRVVAARPDARELHGLMLDLLCAGPRYGIVYAAVMRYSPIAALQALGKPALITARASDVSASSLDRLPPLPAHARVLRLGDDERAWAQAIGDFFAEHAPAGAGRAEPSTQRTQTLSAGALRHGYVSLGHGQLRLRRCGPLEGRPLVLLPAQPGSGAQLEPLMHALRAQRTTIAFDLPGIGDSDRIPDASSVAHDFARALLAALDALGVRDFDLFSVQTSTPIALELAASAPARVGRLVCDGGLALDALERGAWQLELCPALEPRLDGSHWTQAWYLLREQELRWPWFDARASAVRRIEPEFDAIGLNRRVLDVMKQPVTYAQATLAAVAASGEERLRRVEALLLVFEQALDPAHAWSAQVRRSARRAEHLERPRDLHERARHIHQFLA